MKHSHREKHHANGQTRFSAHWRQVIGWSTIIFLAVGSVFIFGIYLVYQRLPTSPLTFEQILIVSDKLDSQNKNTYLASFDIRNRQIQVFQFSSGIKFNVIGGFGEYELRAILPLLAIEHKPAVYQQAAMSWALGSTVDQVWVKNEAVDIKNAVEFKKFIKNYTQQQLTFSQAFLERLKLAAFAESLRNDQIQVIPIESAVDWEEYQTQLTNAKQTACSVAIINATQTTGLATQLGQILENSGLYIIRVADTPSLSDKTQILVADTSQLACQESIQQGQNTLPFSISPQVTDHLYEAYRADVVFILGQDLGSAIQPE